MLVVTMSFNLGGLVSSSNTRTRISGLNSGIDTDKIIEATVEAKLKPVKKIEDAVKFNNEKIGALNELKSYFKDLRDAADILRAAPKNILSTNTNLLAAKKVVLSSNTIANPVNYLDVSATNNVDAQIFNIKVDSIAKPKIQKITNPAFNSVTASVTDIAGINTGRFTAGTFTIGTTDITLVAGDSLSTIASKINAVSDVTKVSATIIQPTLGNYAIQLKSQNTGISNAFTLTDTGNAVMNGMLANVQSAADSQVTIDNSIVISRATNTIVDYVDGLTIKVYNPTLDNISVDVDYDKKTATDSIVNFVEKYNNFIQFANEQQAQDGQGSYLDSAKIRNNTFLSDSKSTLFQQLSSVVSSNGTMDILEKIGIKFPDSRSSIANPQDMNKLLIDSSGINTLTDAVYNNFDKVRKLLEFQYTSTSSNFIVTKRSNNLGSISTFSINVDVNRAEAERAKITYGGTTINATYSNGFIIGPTGTPFEGFELQYLGAGNNETTDIVVSQGIMDKIYNTVDGYLAKRYTDASGTAAMLDAIDLEVTNVSKEIESKNNEIEKKKAKIETDKETMIIKFAEMEKAMAKAQSILEMLKAQQNAMRN